MMGLPELRLNQTKIVLAQNNLTNPHHQYQCSTDVTDLAHLLVKDIPNYANRVIQKSRPSLAQEDFLPLYIITASQPEFEPLKIEQTQYRETKESQVEQIFFTTFERQYPQQNRLISTQNTHWLLLTKTKLGWQMVMLLTRFGTSTDSAIYSPPQDSTNGIIGQAIKLWLRDCRWKFKLFGLRLN
jgi:hypothetical protein